MRPIMKDTVKLVSKACHLVVFGHQQTHVLHSFPFERKTRAKDTIPFTTEHPQPPGVHFSSYLMPKTVMVCAALFPLCPVGHCHSLRPFWSGPLVEQL